MGMEGSIVHVDKEPDGVIIYANGVTHDSDYGNADVAQLPEIINIDPQRDIFECEVKECNNDRSAEVAKLCQVETLDKNMPDDAKSEGQKVTDDDKKRRVCGKKVSKTGAGNCKVKCTVPQPFALATEKRALSGARPYGAESDHAIAGEKPSNVRVVQHPSSMKQNPVSSLFPISDSCLF